MTEYGPAECLRSVLRLGGSFYPQPNTNVSLRYFRVSVVSAHSRPNREKKKKKILCYSKDRIFVEIILTLAKGCGDRWEMFHLE